MKRLSITLTDYSDETLEKICERTGATKQSIIALALAEWLSEHAEKLTDEKYTEAYKL